MLEVPTYILEKIQCAKCDGYLSCGPIVINQENEQLCGRCFKILPDDVKSQCVRQFGYEAIAELLVFPCKYNVQGCTYTFPYNSGTEHQVTCQHRNNTLSTISVRSTSTNDSYVHRSKDLELKIVCDNMFGDDKLKLNVEIAGKDDNKLQLGEDSVKLNFELVVSLDVTPTVNYSHVSIIKQNSEPIYDTVNYVTKCTNCQKNIMNTEIFHCVFGHSLCKLCKSSSCIVCGSLAKTASQRYCKNYNKGCIDLLPTMDLYKHETDCEFNDFKCPLCDFFDSANKISEHVVKNHDVELNELVVNLSKKDQTWYFCCYNKLFRCNYYNFDDCIEFVLVYVGSNDNAKNYKYKVTLTDSLESVDKISYCLGWNETLLKKAVQFDMKTNLRKHLQARITIL